MAKSIIEAIQQGTWDFEPQEVPTEDFSPTTAMPGTNAKRSILAERVRRGLPLWHPSDRSDYDEGRRSS